jgi:head-tail adaptor
MIARELSRKVEIYKTESVEDGFGGYTIEDVLIGKFWANVSQISSFRDNTNGGSYIKDNFSFKIRNNSTINVDKDNLSIVYRGAKYVVNDVQYDDELFRFVNIIANGKGID